MQCMNARIITNFSFDSSSVFHWPKSFHLVQFNRQAMHTVCLFAISCLKPRKRQLYHDTFRP